MMTSRIRGALCLVAAAIAAACENPAGPGGTTQPAAAVNVVSGNGQVGLVGQPLSNPLTVKVAASNGTAVKGATVVFAVTTGSATVSPSSTVTDSIGQAKTSVTFGSTPGNIVITASVTGTSLTATFSLTSGGGSTSTACQSSTPQTPSAGSVTSATGTGICLGGGSAGAQYALVAFYGNPDSSQVQNLTVTGRGATAVLTPNIVPSGGAALLETQPNAAQSAFDRQLRETAQRDLTPLIPAARLRRQQGASFAAIPANPPIGTLVNLNANGIQACTQVNMRTARVAAVSNTAIIVADTGNPANGFSDTEYAGFATMFDTLINPLDVANFGAPSDIDNNGKVIIFFTKEVNALTPKSSTGGVVGGFFFERDLFPTTDQNGLTGCPGSNVAEMFYMLVPDPTGIFSIAHSKDYVNTVTPGTLAHEYQHLINAGRRLYVNNADGWEDTWLNEGLSHIAEELLFYRVSGSAPGTNLGVTELRASTPLRNAFNQYQIDNIGRYQIFLGMPSATSVYGDGDPLELRGAIWNLLRYLADHHGGTQSDTWKALVNSTTNGQRNLARVFGSDYMTQIGNWAVSVFSDDVAGVTDQRFLEQSWNMRSIYPNLVNSQNVPLGKFPLQVLPLSDASAVNASVFAGGVAYLRFSVAAGGQASIDWTAGGGLPVSPLMSFTVVRTQ